MNPLIRRTPIKTLIAFALVACSTVPALAQTNVGVSVGINQPGVYGRIDIGNYSPALVYSQPVIIVRQPVAVQPVYLYVPADHQKQWSQHCGHYGACAQPVYFVQERWVRERYNEQRGQGHGKGRGKGHGNDQGNDQGNGHGNKQHRNKG
jgi:hypothetical protein